MSDEKVESSEVPDRNTVARELWNLSSQIDDDDKYVVIHGHPLQYLESGISREAESMGKRGARFIREHYGERLEQVFPSNYSMDRRVLQRDLSVDQINDIKKRHEFLDQVASTTIDMFLDNHVYDDFEELDSRIRENEEMELKKNLGIIRYPSFLTFEGSKKEMQSAVDKSVLESMHSEAPLPIGRKHKRTIAESVQNRLDLGISPDIINEDDEIQRRRMEGAHIIAGSKRKGGIFSRRVEPRDSEIRLECQLILERESKDRQQNERNEGRNIGPIRRQRYEARGDTRPLGFFAYILSFLKEPRVILGIIIFLLFIVLISYLIYYFIKKNKKNKVN